MNNRTIIYYTSNREDPNFEEKIRANILKEKGDIPVISVSQKPITFGTNICVGDVGHSYLNAWRQLLIGVKKAKTPYVVLAEADFLYPPEYFRFEPTGADSYRYNNIWVVFAYKYRWYFRKAYSEGARVCKREYIISQLEHYLAGQPEWFDGKLYITDKSGRIKKTPFDMPVDVFDGKTACVSFKTGRGVRWMTDVMHGHGTHSRQLPHWGHVDKLMQAYAYQKPGIK